MNNKAYKIRNSMGLFSPGGLEAWQKKDINGMPEYEMLTFVKEGKTWNRIGHVKAHLKGLTIIGSDWEIIEYELVEKQTYKASSFKHTKAITTDELIIKNIIE